MKTTKRLLAAIMALAVVSAVAPMSAFATDYDAEGNALSDVTWTSNAAYTVTIPATVALGDTATISAENVNLNAEEQLNVTLSGTSDAENAFKLTTDTDSLTYTVSKGDDNVSVGDTVLSVLAGTTGGSSVLTFNEPATTPNAGDYTGTVTFTISVKSAKTNVASVTIDDKTTTALTKGNTLNLSATVDDAATDKTITWSSSDDTVASVDGTGKVTANKTGTATITVTATNGTEDTADDKTDTITITVTNPANGITLNKSTLTLTKGGNETLTATVDPTDADGTVEWSSNKTSVATVDNNGKITAVDGGTATITATIGSKSATCVVTVNVPVSGVAINSAPTELTEGDTGTLTATVSPDNATNKAVTWSSSNTSVLSINETTGAYEANAEGTATITATAGGKTDTCTITVKPSTIAVTGITIDNAPTEALFVNTKGTLTATVSPDNATDKTVTWSSSDPDYVSINATTGEYEVKGTKGYGSATITATAGDKTATCVITGKVTYTSLSVGTVLHTGDTFYTGGTVAFQTSPLMSFNATNGVITVVEATSGSSKCYKFQRGSNGTMPNVTTYKVKDNTDGVYITGGSGTNSDRFTLAVFMVK